VSRTETGNEIEIIKIPRYADEELITPAVIGTI